MKLIALESSGLTASVAIAEDGIIRAEYTTDYKKTHSETLLPMLDEIMKRIGLPKEEVEAVAVSAGPGSFTGLRIGSATAKGIALALDIPIVEVPTLAGLAYNLCGSSGIVCPVMDARREQVYNALFRFEGTRLLRLTEDRALGVRELLQELNERYAGEQVTFLGDAAAVYGDALRELSEGPCVFAPPHLSRQRAASVAVLGMALFKEGRAVPSAAHVPVYLRKSQAEREREQKGLLKGDRT